MTEVFELVEAFSTWQGEGPDSGKLMFLVRFRECSRKKPCPFCDTQVKMRTSLPGAFRMPNIQSGIYASNNGLLITGGEPTYGDNFIQTVKMINELDYSVCNVETNGYQLLELVEEVDLSKPIKFMYSPKFFNTKELEQEMKNIDNFVHMQKLFIKLVVSSTFVDISSLEKMLDFLNDKNMTERVYLMPEGKTRDEIVANSPLVFDLAEYYKTNFSSRNHIIYGFF